MNVYLVLAVALIFYFIIPFIVIVFVRNRKISNAILGVMFAVFLIVLFVGIYFKISFVNNKVFAVADFSGKWFNKEINLSFKNIPKLDLFVNLVMLIPIGIVCRYLTYRKKLSIRIVILLIVAILSGVLTELGQFIMPIPRGVQLSDCVFNIISVLVGGIFASLCFVIKKAIYKNRIM